MKYYRLNQIAMAVLGALLLFFGARTLIHIMFEEPEEKPGYEVPGTKAEKPTEQKPSEAAQLATLLAKADPAKGADVAKKCEICHNFEKGGPNMIGPNLYGVLGRKVASHEGYDYSDALKAKAAEIGTWGYDSVSEMDANPSAFVPGTKMALFQGLPDIKERADLLAFVRTKNDNPPPLPEVKETPKPGGETTPPAAPAAGGNEFMAALAKADPKAGEADTALCKVCHTFNKGGATLVGPNLYGVVGRKIASEDGFNYTPGLKAHEADWTFDKLNEWLTNPAAFAPGTMMAFPGIPDVKKRADVIAYLNSNSDSPLPIPKPGAGGAEGEKGAAAPAAAPMTPPAAAPEAAPAAPAAPAPAAAPEAAPAAPAAPAPEAAPKAETPPAPTPEAAPPAETKPAPEGAPSAETPPAPAPSAETPPAPAPEAAPSAETPPAPAPEAAPSAETPPAPAPEAAPPTEENQSVHPNGAPEAQSETPSSPATEAEPSGEDSTLSNQPQPVYPNGAPDAQ
jgi:cytochrome c